MPTATESDAARRARARPGREPLIPADPKPWLWSRRSAFELIVAPAAFAIIAGAIGGWFAAAEPARYEASAAILVDPARGSGLAGLDDAVLARVVRSQATIVKSSAVVDVAAAELGVPAVELISALRTETAADSQLFTLRARATTGAEALRRLDAVVHSYTRFTVEADDPAIPTVSDLRPAISVTSTRNIRILKIVLSSAALAFAAVFALCFVRRRVAWVP